MSVLDKIVSFFTARGWSDAQARGIAGNLYGESNWNPTAVGDGGKAYGLAQWHPDRQNIFQRIFGKSIKSSSFEEQLSFIDYELRNNEKRAGNMLAQQTTIEGATEAFMRYYERPANMSSLGKRIEAAGGAIARQAESFLTNPFGSITDGLGITGEGSTIGWLQELFSYRTAGRFAAVAIGIVLVALAIAALVLTSDVGKTVVTKGIVK